MNKTNARMERTKMKQNKLNSTRLLAGTCSLAALLMTGPLAFAQQNNPSHPPASAPPQGALSSRAASAVAGTAVEEEQSPKAAKPGAEGIKIHGHWVLELKNRDGKLVDRREFDNSLVTNGFFASGDQVLAALLSGNAVSGDPGVLFVGAQQQNPDSSELCGQGGQGIGCYAFTTTNSPLNEAAFKFQYALGAIQSTQTGLTVTVNFSPSVSWVLTGNFTVPSGLTSLYTVQTAVPLCGPLGSINTAFGGGSTESFKGSFPDSNGDIAPKTCTASQTTDAVYPAILTSTGVPNAPMAVSQGQVITVTVTISFS